MQPSTASQLSQPPPTAFVRRVSDLADPKLIGALRRAGGIGLAIGLVALFAVMSQKTHEVDRSRLAVAAQYGATQIEAILARAETGVLKHRAALDAALAPNATDVERLAARRAIVEAAADSPILGATILDASGSVELDVGAVDATGFGPVIAPFRFEDARRIDQRARLMPAPERNALLLAIPMDAPSPRTLVLALDASVFTDSLVLARNTAAKAPLAFLSDRDGRLILASGADVSRTRVVVPAMPAEHQSIEDMAVSELARESDESNSEMACAPLASGQLAVHVIGAKVDVWRLTQENWQVLVAAFAPMLLALILAVSFVQNEWRRRDRRANTSADAVARAEIAADLLDAGVLEWRISDSGLSSSEGWRTLFAEGAAVADEDISNWLSRIHPDDEAAARQGYQSLQDGERDTLSQMLRVRGSSGAYIKVQERARVRRGRDDKPVRIVMVHTLVHRDPLTVRE